MSKQSRGYNWDSEFFINSSLVISHSALRLYFGSSNE